MKIFIIGIVLIAIIEVISAESGCLCGGLGEGLDSCKGSSGHGIGIRGHRGPRPQYRASVAAINEAIRQREMAAAIERSKAVTVGGNAVAGCGGIATTRTLSGYADGTEAYSDEESSKSINGDTGLSVSELLALGSDAVIAPSFSAVERDPCFGGAKSSSYSLDGSSKMVIVPARPAKPRCLTCGGYTSGSNGAVSYASSGYASSGYANSAHSSSSSSSTSSAPWPLSAFSSHNRKCGCGSSGAASRTEMSSNTQVSKTAFSRGGKGVRKENGASTESDLIGFGTSDRGAGQMWAGSRSQGVAGFGRSLSGYTGHGMLGGASGLHESMATRRFISPLGTNQAGSFSTGLNEFDMDGEGPTLSFEEQEKIYNRPNTVPVVPADAVSVALAYKKILEPLQSLARGEGLGQGNGRTISESPLFFGAKSIPADGRVKQVESDIPEEKLSTVDKPIVELKPQSITAARARNGGSCDESEQALAEQEAIERERLIQEEADCCSNKGQAAYISYSDLGYGPVASSRNTFVARSTVNPSSRSSTMVTGGNVIGGSEVSRNVEIMGRHEVTSKTSYSSGGVASEDDGGPCGPVGVPLPDYEPGRVYYETAATNVAEQAEAKSRAAEAEAARIREADDDGSYDSSEDEDVATTCDGSIPVRKGPSENVMSGRLSRMWSTIPARVADNCDHFTS